MDNDQPAPPRRALDTHVIRLGRCLKLTRYVSPGWKMAADITAALRAIDPHDPSLRLLAVPRRDDECLRLRPARRRRAVPAKRPVCPRRRPT
jgi:hypothetical protein